MSRRTRAVRRQIPEDPHYGSHVVQKFINGLMLDGKKSLAERTFYEAMGIVEAKAGQPPMNIFRQALTNAKPALEVKSRRVGGATYQVPIEVRPERRQSLAIKWLIGFARQRGERTMAQRLAAEVLSASRGEGATVKKKDDTHRMAEANKAFAHYRW
ncbi:MAG: 30S ribosomal protein S7 [Gemmatimonadetes bacterium]|nr:30S ribosomal protein S7 [Gemmatimonadota bacterium]MDE2679085.1 30S ribosomal protein S7 [Gemmatimonadota bacterium]MXX33511.1 30S ribosomal protein S7 [Gemmatimonadota bacterium]MYA12523.1 30S ribosomal protein S7 [Gemmatimonadota bacterium]MYD14610.1 30S ribosomal protein S7 [Gemmatimonadota bacterium]